MPAVVPGSAVTGEHVPTTIEPNGPATGGRPAGVERRVAQDPRRDPAISAGAGSTSR